MKSLCLFPILVLLCPAFAHAQMVYPISVATSGDRIVIADLNLPGIWEVKNGKVEKILQGEKKFREPLNRIRCVAFDKQGKLIAGDSATREIYRIEDGKPVPLTKGNIGIPMSIAVDSGGDLIVADLELGRIFKVPSSGGEPTVIGKVAAPRSLFVDSEDTIWVASGSKTQLVKINSKGEQTTVVANRPFKYPSAVILNEAGEAFVCDSYAKAVWKVSAEGKAEKWAEGSFVHPVGMAKLGEKILVIDPRSNSLFSIGPDGSAEVLVKSTE